MKVAFHKKTKNMAKHKATRKKWGGKGGGRFVNRKLRKSSDR